MSQMSFSDFEYAGKRKQTRRERFLAEMDQVVPWAGLLELIEYIKSMQGAEATQAVRPASGGPAPNENTPAQTPPTR